MPRLGHIGREDAELSTGLDIQAPVAHDRTRGHIDVPIVAGLTEQKRAGLAALAVRFGDVGAVVERVRPGLDEAATARSTVRGFAPRRVACRDLAPLPIDSSRR